MSLEPHFEHNKLLEIIPEASREELNGITEMVRIQLDQYNTDTFNLIVGAIGRRIIELGAPVPF